MNHRIVLLQWNICWATPTDKYHLPTGELPQNYTSRMLEQYKQAPHRVMNWTVHWHLIINIIIIIIIIINTGLCIYLWRSPSPALAHVGSK